MHHLARYFEDLAYVINDSTAYIHQQRGLIQSGGLKLLVTTFIKIIRTQCELFSLTSLLCVMHHQTLDFTVEDLISDL